MVGALILINTEIGTMEKVLNKVKKMDNIEKTEMLTGPFDVMVIAKAKDIQEATDILIKKIRNIEGVKQTTTNIFIE